MEQEVHTVNSHSRGHPQVHNRYLVTLGRVMALQLHSDTQWECKDVPQEAWVACPMVHRYFVWFVFSEISALCLNLIFISVLVFSSVVFFVCVLCLDGILWTTGTRRLWLPGPGTILWPAWPGSSPKPAANPLFPASSRATRSDALSRATTPSTFFCSSCPGRTTLSAAPHAPTVPGATARTIARAPTISATLFSSLSPTVWPVSLRTAARSSQSGSSAAKFSDAPWITGTV